MKNIRTLSLLFVFILTLSLGFASVLSATEPLAETNTAAESPAAPEDASIGQKATAAAIVVGAASAVAAVSMGLAISKCAESMARQPEAAGKINSAMMLGLVFIETLVIYALIVAILIIFVL